tara:strand:+ start:69 stop:572 length:504 start_codon:yes stop_codon:yes gene_type:complete
MAQSKRTAASYIAEQRNTTAGNPFMGKTLAEMKKMYSKMTPKQRGENVETFRRAAAAAAKGSTNKSKVTTQVKKTATKQQQTPTPTTPSNTRQKRQRGSTGGRGRAPSGTHGQFLPSNPKLKSQPKPTRRTKRGSGVKGRKLKMFNLTAMLRELGGADPKTGRRKKN